jgi:O-antigen ligase
VQHRHAGLPRTEYLAAATCLGGLVSLCLGLVGPFLVLSCGFVITALMHQAREPTSRLRTPGWSFMAAALWCLGGALFSHWPAASCAWWGIGLAVCLVAWQGASYPWSAAGRKILAVGVIAAGGAVGLTAVLEFVATRQEATVRMAHPNRLASFLLMTVPVAYAWGRARRRGPWRLGAVAGGVAMLGGMLVTFSRGGWLGILAEILYISPRKRGRAALLVVVALALVWLVLPWEMTGFARTLSPGYQTNLSRLREWGAALRLISEEPVWGVGVGNYARAAGTTSLVPHNFFLHTAAQTGLVGLALLVTLFWRVWKDLRRRVEGGANPWATAATVAMVGLLAQGLVDF